MLWFPSRSDLRELLQHASRRADGERQTVNTPRQRTLWEPDVPYAKNYTDHRHDWQPTDEWLNAPHQFGTKVDMQCQTCTVDRLPPFPWRLLIGVAVFIGGLFGVIITGWFGYWVFGWILSTVCVQWHERFEKRWYQERIKWLAR